ncbi:hypothetical protein F4810DRAFT_697259 [Camillea tinctor]|nr:hypothetical protein F4810DRAFT_697259 [Camillea tinctor]
MPRLSVIAIVLPEATCAANYTAGRKTGGYIPLYGKSHPEYGYYNPSTAFSTSYSTDLQSRTLQHLTILYTHSDLTSTPITHGTNPLKKHGHDARLPTTCLVYSGPRLELMHCL